ncbi:MAG: asparagine synthase (glutamine-hydrolyzing) [Candidatus Riflebacteria bacterium]|nr:asparagine synthase (glutamine-hydrolyzing) [Candidatus Riflebacteria bacterium]
MCGIFGIVAPDSIRLGGSLRLMMRALQHRGPDGSGLRFFDDCGLGHVRLSIIDLSTGNQPMDSAVKRKSISFNGEIYGYKQIRESMSDYPFKTTSDTEVILALYENYGETFLDHLPGIFSFAIWDDDLKELICARDRFGEKPFYYAWGKNGEFIFASEIKGLIASGLIDPELSRRSVGHYLRHLYVHPFHTIYSNVFSLPPGHMLRLSSGNLRIRKYWDLPTPRDSICFSDAIEEGTMLLERAVKLQLIADVPVGAFLSGGVDSSTIVAIASRSVSRLKTISFDFEASSSDLAFARLIADKYHTDHVELSDSEIDLPALIEKMQEVYDEPFADSSNIPTFLISLKAREFAKVILTGDGGDELFGGYSSWYRPFTFWNKPLLQFPASVGFLRLLTKCANRWGYPLNARLSTLSQAVYLRTSFATVSQAHIAQNSFFSQSEMESMGFPDDNNIKPPYSLSQSNTLDDALRMDLLDYMPGDILVKIDRASMANGIELRAPFLDRDLASFCISLPYRLKVSSRSDKILLREISKHLLPTKIIHRSKMGFGAPVSEWLSRPAFQSMKEKISRNTGGKIYSLLPFAQTKNFLDGNDFKSWILLNLSLWLEKHTFR